MSPVSSLSIIVRFFFVCICDKGVLANSTLFHRQVREKHQKDTICFPCATCLFFDCLCQRGSQQHGIHYPSTISTLTETEDVMKKFTPLSLQSCLRGHDIIQHIITLSHFFWEFNKSLCLHILSRKTPGYEVSFQITGIVTSSSVLPRSVSHDAEREGARFQFMGNI